MVNLRSLRKFGSVGIFLSKLTGLRSDKNIIKISTLLNVFSIRAKTYKRVAEMLVEMFKHSMVLRSSLNSAHLLLETLFILTKDTLHLQPTVFF